MSQDSPRGVRGEIMEFLADNRRAIGWSDAEIAGYIGRPLPSVRRTRRELELDNQVALAPTSTSSVLRWVLRK